MASVSGTGLAAVGAGAVFVYAGLKGVSVLKAIQNVVQGQPAIAGQTPAGLTSGTVASPAGGTITPGNSSGNRALGQQMAAAYGWTGAQWRALDDLWTRESQWSDTVTNPTSGAAGIAQKISGFDSSYQSGDASQQIAWGLSYIQGRYGDPVTAWAHEQANGWY